MPTTSAPAASPRAPELSGRFTTLPDRRLTSLPPRVRGRLTAIALWGNLIAQIGIILSGGAVRLTGSGLGCSTWPNCEPGQFTPEFTMAAGIHPFVEFGNRTLTGVVSFFAIAVLLVSWRWLAHKGTSFRVLSCLPLVGTGLQAGIGALVVIADLHPGLVSPHFLISPLLVALAAVLVVRLYDGDGRTRRAVPAAALRVYFPLAAVGFVVLVLGTIVTGTGPHSGDAGDITRISLDPVLASRIHAIAVYVFCALLAALLVILHRARSRREAVGAAWLLVGLTLAQGVVGYIQYFTGLPELLVFLHLLGAALFAAGIAWLGARLFTWQHTPAPGAAAPESSARTPADPTETR
ncbi:heme A synthase [Brachybacterium sp. YJGR34]|uniref:COX15/CtaA family protein n=1 Tax=Brachybacterium sp. YJGR34 TaxID=2059911 RepID=UPI0013004AA0|nr:COX15/CtaA family protein [Brachybacterium sp. YJGR34]